MRSHTRFSRRVVARAQRELGLSPGQPKVLDFLIDHPGCDQKTIAAHCEIEPATLGAILLRMEEKGLIQRRHPPGNRRSLVVDLTDPGREAAGAMQAIFRQEEAKAASSMTPAEVQALTALLAAFCAGLDQAEEVGQP